MREAGKIQRRLFFRPSNCILSCANSINSMFLKNTFEKSWVISSRSNNYLFLSKFFHKKLRNFRKHSSYI